MTSDGYLAVLFCDASRREKFLNSHQLAMFQLKIKNKRYQEKRTRRSHDQTCLQNISKMFLKVKGEKRCHVPYSNQVKDVVYKEDEGQRHSCPIGALHSSILKTER